MDDFTFMNEGEWRDRYSGAMIFEEYIRDNQKFIFILTHQNLCCFKSASVGLLLRIPWLVKKCEFLWLRGSGVIGRAKDVSKQIIS